MATISETLLSRVTINAREIDKLREKIAVQGVQIESLKKSVVAKDETIVSQGKTIVTQGEKIVVLENKNSTLETEVKLLREMLKDRDESEPKRDETPTPKSVHVVDPLTVEKGLTDIEGIEEIIIPFESGDSEDE